jgi:hypothetical protein
MRDESFQWVPVVKAPWPSTRHDKAIPALSNQLQVRCGAKSGISDDRDHLRPGMAVKTHQHPANQSVLRPRAGDHPCGGFHLPAADKIRQDLVRSQRLVCCQQRLGLELPCGIATQHPLNRDHRLTRVVPDGRLGSDLDMSHSLAMPVCHGYRSPSRRRSGQDVLKCWHPLVLLARASVLPRWTRRGRLIERRIAAQTGDHTHGVTDRITPFPRRIRAVTHDDQLPCGQPALHQPHGVPCTVQQRSGGTAALLIVAFLGR